MKKIIGRREESMMLLELLRSPRPSLVAVYGRRRVGKTFLVRNIYADRLTFELTGTYSGTLEDQLLNFSKSLEKAAGTPLALRPPASWTEAFAALENFLSKLSKRKKRVVFFDEFPWLDGRRSGFLGAFEHFWNNWASRYPHIVVVVCGSAASWMIRNIVNSKGGLHQRITHKLRLQPFDLKETEEYLRHLGSNLNRYQLLQLYMALGGIPEYLNNVSRGESAAAAIQKICFSKNGLLAGEFNNLYGSLFELADSHIKTVRALAAKPSGLTRKEIIELCKLSSGGTTTLMLDELEQSGFIQSSLPFGKISRDAVYRLVDEYSLFYLKFMDKKSGKQEWSRISEGNTYRVWCGMAFEGICLKHVEQIKNSLGLTAQQTSVGSWRFTPAKNSGEEGAQIDLLIDRDDHCVNLCEIKIYAEELVIDKAYAAELQRKTDALRAVVSRRKTIFLTLITTFGVKRNIHFNSLVHQSLELDSLFI